MTFTDIPAGAAVFLDANVLVYAIVPHPVYGSACERLLDRVEQQDIQGFTSAPVLADNLTHLASSDADFDRIPGITRYSPV